MTLFQTIVFVQFVVYLVISLTGIFGHLSSLLILGVRKTAFSLKTDTLDDITQGLLLCVSAVSLWACAIGMPLRAWNVMIGPAWPFTNQWLLGLQFYSGNIALNVIWQLGTMLAITRFTATFFPHQQVRWMRKRWLNCCLYGVSSLIDYVSALCTHYRLDDLVRSLNWSLPFNSARFSRPPLCTWPSLLFFPPALYALTTFYDFSFYQWHTTACHDCLSPTESGRMLCKG